MNLNTLYHRLFVLCVTVMVLSSCTQNNDAETSSYTMQPLETEDLVEVPVVTPQKTVIQGGEIQVEDENARIDELRVDGQTQRIEVTPQNGMPAYEVVPYSPAEPDNDMAGRSRWRIVNF